MMFKKGSFEIGATVYPVAIKVSLIDLIDPPPLFKQFVHNNTCMYSSLWCVFDSHSMILASEMLSGIAASLEWSTTFCV